MTAGAAAGQEVENMSNAKLAAAKTAGAATAKYLPADPAFWLQCCGAAGIQVVGNDSGLAFIYDQSGPDREQAEFLEAWLRATPGGMPAVAAILRQTKR
jgi:hypothetical protein